MAARFSAGSDALAALVRQRQDTQDRLDADDAAILKAVKPAALPSETPRPKRRCAPMRMTCVSA